jgi:DNA damage-binding protein 1
LIIDPKGDSGGEPVRRLEIGVLHKTIGPVHDVATVNGLLAVASASQVSPLHMGFSGRADHQVTILRLTLSPLSLTEKHTFSSTFIAQHLHVLPPAPAAPRTGAAAAQAMAAGGGDVDMEDMGVTATSSPVEEVLEERLVVGDGMRSISVLDVDPKTGAIYRETRDMATHSVAGLGGVKDGGEGVIISDVSWPFRDPERAVLP